MYPHNLLPFEWPSIYLYGIMIAVGVLAAFLVLFKFGKKLSVSDKFTDFVFYNGIVSIAIGFGAAAVFQAFYDYLENPSAGFHIGERITFIGGLIGGVICFLVGYIIFKKRCGGTLSQIVSIAPCSILIGHGFGRIGCFFAGCCYGAETNSIFGVVFDPATEAGVGGLHRHPTQLYEAIFLFAMFALCTWLLLKKNFKHNMSVYLVSYGIFRFLIEYLRDDARGSLADGISPSQFWSIFMVIIGVALFFWLEYFWKTHPRAFNTPEMPEKKKKSSDSQ